MVFVFVVVAKESVVVDDVVGVSVDVVIFVVVAIESVAVGVVVKNPLKGIPLLLTNLCLVWDGTPITTPSSPPPRSPSTVSQSQQPAALCEVVKRVLLQPEEEKMVMG